MRKSTTGFTIVELLIVIVVIAILAAISIVAYNGIQNRANDTTLMSDISTARKKLELYNVDFSRYPQSNAQFPEFKISKSAYDTTQNNVYYITDTVNNNYALGVRSKSMKGYILTNSGLQEGVTVNGAATASAIGVTWAAAGTVAIQGYSSSGSGTWSTTWPWVN